MSHVSKWINNNSKVIVSDIEAITFRIGDVFSQYFWSHFIATLQFIEFYLDPYFWHCLLHYFSWSDYVRYTSLSRTRINGHPINNKDNFSYRNSPAEQAGHVPAGLPGRHSQVAATSSSKTRAQGTKLEIIIMNNLKLN